MEIPSVPYDLDAAKRLLAEAGWKDSDGDNVLDKKIDGKKVNLSIEVTYPQGRAFYKDIATNLKYEAERVGIEIELNGMEGSSMYKKMTARDYELVCVGWGGVPMPDDFTQIWHSESNRADGSNLVGFESKRADKLIEKIKLTTDEAKRTEMYKEFQRIVVKEHPYVFLLSPQSCMSINNKFKNTKVSSVRPGYTVRLFELAE
jgi:peptide/nickel transport system substrate-binding protein